MKKTALARAAGLLLAAVCVATLTSDVLLAEAGTGFPFDTAPRILVGLTRASSVTLSCQSALALGGSVSPVDPAPPVMVPAGSAVTLTATSSGISWGYTPPGGATQVGHSAGTVLFGTTGLSGSQPAPSQPPAPAAVRVDRLQGATASIAGRSYRGSILAIPSAGAILLANVVDMEDYVQSTVAAEVPTGWPDESQKAQAVAVRTFAAYRLGLARGAVPKDCEAKYCSVTDADVLLWASEQVYRGVDEENPQSVAATRDTRGLVLLWDGSPAATFFHSSAGGMTEEPKYVWGGTIPYLRAVEEIPHQTPYSFWSVRLTADELASGLKSQGIIPSPLPDIIAGYGPGKSGRWTGVALATSRGPAQLPATTFRAAFGQVRSMLFSSFAFGGGGETRGLLSSGLPAFVQGDGQTRVATLRDMSVLGASGASFPAYEGAYASTGAQAGGPKTYVLTGSGWGHGVGLSQYGARAMALAGSDHAAILGLYYPGTVQEKWWP